MSPKGLLRYVADTKRSLQRNANPWQRAMSTGSESRGSTRFAWKTCHPSSAWLCSQIWWSTSTGMLNDVVPSGNRFWSANGESCMNITGGVQTKHEAQHEGQNNWFIMGKIRGHCPPASMQCALTRESESRCAISERSWKESYHVIAATSDAVRASQAF